MKVQPPMHHPSAVATQMKQHSREGMAISGNCAFHATDTALGLHLPEIQFRVVRDPDPSVFLVP